LAGRVIRHQCQPAFIVKTLERADRGEGWVSKAVKVADAFAKHGLEARRRHEIVTESEQLERRRPGVVEHQQPVAETVGPPWDIPAGEPIAGLRSVSLLVASAVHVILFPLMRRP